MNTQSPLPSSSDFPEEYVLRVTDDALAPYVPPGVVLQVIPGFWPARGDLAIFHHRDRNRVPLIGRVVAGVPKAVLVDFWSTLRDGCDPTTAPVWVVEIFQPEARMQVSSCFFKAVHRVAAIYPPDSTEPLSKVDLPALPVSSRMVLS